MFPLTFRIAPQPPSRVRSRPSPQAPPRAAPLRRAALAASAASLSLVGSLAAGAGPAVALGSPGVGDHLTVTVRDVGKGADGTFQVSCHPGAGTHPDVAGACRAVDRNTRWGRDAFAPVPDGGMCTARYGGPATAHVSGQWAGRAVDATYDRSDGCEIARWDRFVPLLPEVGSAGR
ncbi:SSI family serine proteinase inhibitor [Streptomyces sp. NPDC051315]|uniref:SSI family serine proteinase inhibitor n=1 Tax=Streptomyces sp. NPDC051315 TaxID=3365650 RepID=UPI0037B362F3